MLKLNNNNFLIIKGMNLGQSIAYPFKNIFRTVI